MKILDCTLRDGGYYTNWDFDSQMVDDYIESMNNLPVEYLEVGYRSPDLKGYYGEYFYLPPYVMKRLKEQSNKKLVIILNEKDIRENMVKDLLSPCIGYIDMVRLAIDPQNLERAIDLAKAVKEMGFQVGFNVMYMSKWKTEKEFLKALPHIKGVVDIFYMVDSYGGVYPEDVRDTYNMIREIVNVPIGFHGHNNMELGLINTLTAIECGAEMVDVTVTGMGRGAGNCKTELLLTALNAKGSLAFDYNALTKVVDSFTNLQKKYEWGTNLPYMVSGANSLPQKDVMDWVGKRYYSFNSIIRALHNQSSGMKDNRTLDKFDFSDKQVFKKAMIVGGGQSVLGHEKGIEAFLEANPDIVIIHASSRNAMSFSHVSNEQFFCMIGNEGYRLESVFGGTKIINGTCILPPYPRKMGTYIPKMFEDDAKELTEVSFTNILQDTHTALALQTVIALGVKEAVLVGYDGYADHVMGRKEQELFKENEYLFTKAMAAGIKLVSFTPTTYEVLEQQSIYSNI